MKLIALPDEIILHILEFIVKPNYHEPFLHNPSVLRMAIIQSINKNFSLRIKHFTDEFWKSLLLNEFGSSNQEFIKLIDEQIKSKKGLKRKALLLRKLAMQNLVFPTTNGCSECRVVVHGIFGSGKTSLTSRFITGEFPEVTDPTIDDSYRKIINLDNNLISYVLDILDTSGIEEYIAMRDSYIRMSQAFIVTASLDFVTGEWKKYFEDLLQQMVRVKELGSESYVPIVFVVNKSDLKQEERQSTFEEWKIIFNSLIEKFKFMNCEIIETSAKSDINVFKIFELTTRMFFHSFFPHVHFFKEVIELDVKVFDTEKKKCILQ